MIKSFLVSIIIPVYNQAKYIEKAIKSSLNQTYKSIEIIVIDDGSTDDLNFVLNKYKDNISLIKKDNGGLASARNLGMKMAKGKYIQFLDADDTIDKDKIEKQSKILEQTDSTIGGIICRYRMKNDNDEIIKYQSKYINKRIAFNELILKNSIAVHCLLIKSDIIKQYSFDESLYSSEDWDMWLNLSKDNKVFITSNEILTNYYRYGLSMRDNGKIMCESRMKVFKKYKKYIKGHQLWKDAELQILRACAWDYYSSKLYKDGTKYILKQIYADKMIIRKFEFHYNYFYLYNQLGESTSQISLRRMIYEKENLKPYYSQKNRIRANSLHCLANYVYVLDRKFTLISIVNLIFRFPATIIYLIMTDNYFLGVMKAILRSRL